MSSLPLPRKTAVLVFICLLVGTWAVSFFNITRFWGLLPAGKPAAMVLLAWALPCMAVLWGLDGRLAERAIQRADSVIGRAGLFLRGAWLAAVSGGLFLLAWTFRSGNHFMGDGWMYLNKLSGPFSLMPDRPLDSLVHHLVHRLLENAGRADPELSYAILHCALLPFFMLALWSLSGRITGKPVPRTALTLIMAGSSALMLFCGYAESYTLLAFFTTLYLAAGAASLRRDGYRTSLPWSASIFYLLAFLSHRSAVVLGPSLLFLWLFRLWRNGTDKQPLKQFFLVLALSPIPLIIAFIMHSPSLSLLTPVFRTTEIAPYTLPSLPHLLEKLNFLLLIAPVSVIAAPVLVTGWRGIRSGINPLFLFLSLAMLGSVFFTFAVNPMLGVRDWDLLSICAVPLAAWSGYIMLHCIDDRRGNTLLATSLGLLFHSLLWVWINSDIYRGVAFLHKLRYEDPHITTGKTNFSTELFNRGFIQESIEQNRLAKGSMYIRGLVNNAEIFMQLGQPDSTIFYTREAIEYEKKNDLLPTPLVWVKGAAAFEAIGQPDSANYYYLKPLRGDRKYYSVAERQGWITATSHVFEENLNKAARDHMNLDYILFFLRYNSMAGRDEYIARTYDFYKAADFNKDQWAKLLDFAIVSRHSPYTDTLKIYAYRQYPELKEVFEKKR